MGESVFDEIKGCIDEKKSFCFNAGAGSGKTFSLVQTVDYILKNNSVSLKNNNQKILVITYTNAATNEIVDRIGSTKLLDVSTIHERLWNLINGFQNDLVSIHSNKIDKEMKVLETKMNENPFRKDDVLGEYITKSEFQSDYFKYRSQKADELKKYLNKYTSNGISNVSKFKEYVNLKIRYIKFQKTIENIQNKVPKYTKVEYDPLNNHDRLYNMRFSHDTLIEYANLLIERSYTMKRIIIDTYPYILVDEFQDTNPQVVALLSLIDKISQRKCMVGYFGDICQNIYTDGIGNQLNNIHTNLYEIYKPDNRRSARKIVEIANRIRNDSFSQCAYLDREGSSQIFYTDCNDYIQEFIESSVKNFPDDEEVHCLVLKNEFVAQQSGFGIFYNIITSTKYYSDRFDQQSTEILSNDIKRLGKIPLLIYKLINLYSNIHNSKLPIDKYIPRQVYSKINAYTLIKLKEKMKNIKSENLLMFIEGIFTLAKENNDFATIMKENIGTTFNFELDGIKNYLLDELYGQDNDENIEGAKENIKKLLLLDFHVLLCWYNYVSRNVKERIQFHTFHGTKGLEYKNVVIILTNDFNRKRDYFHKYFENYDVIDSYSDDDFLKRRNLLYVAVTRTKENLKLLYVDSSYNSVKEQFENIFGDAIKWNEDQ